MAKGVDADKQVIQTPLIHLLVRDYFGRIVFRRNNGVFREHQIGQTQQANKSLTQRGFHVFTCIWVVELLHFGKQVIEGANIEAISDTGVVSVFDVFGERDFSEWIHCIKIRVIDTGAAFGAALQHHPCARESASYNPLNPRRRGRFLVVFEDALNQLGFVARYAQIEIFGYIFQIHHAVFIEVTV